MMKSKTSILASVLFFLALTAGTLVGGTQQEVEEMDLPGKWAFQMDGLVTGLDEKWFAKELKDTIKLTGETLIPRQDISWNGLIAEYEIYVSNDARKKGDLAAKGTLPSDTTLQKIEFDRPVTGQYVTMIAIKGFGGDKSASLAEFGLIVGIDHEHHKCGDTR